MTRQLVDAVIVAGFTLAAVAAVHLLARWQR